MTSDTQDPTPKAPPARAIPAPADLFGAAHDFSTQAGRAPQPLHTSLVEMDRRARHLAAQQAAPRHWMLLLAELSAEAAVHFRLVDEPEMENGYAMLARTLEAQAQTLPAERPAVRP